MNKRIKKKKYKQYEELEHASFMLAQSELIRALIIYHSTLIFFHSHYNYPDFGCQIGRDE